MSSLELFLKDLRVFVCVCVGVPELSYVHHMFRFLWMPEEGARSPELELQAVLSHRNQRQEQKCS